MREDPELPEKLGSQAAERLRLENEMTSTVPELQENIHFENGSFG